jgi:hypothetical protein
VIDGMKASGLLKQLATSQLTADPGNIPTITVS